MADDVQAPDEGAQGAEPTTGGLFDSYLQAVPEDARETVASYLKDAEKNVNSRLQEAAELQKTLGPYRQIDGLDQYQPDQLAQLLAWHQQVSNPDIYQQWLAEQAREAGLIPEQTDTPDPEAEDGDLTPERIQQIIDERTQQGLQPVQQQMAEWQEAQQVNDTEAEIRDDLKRIETENKLELSEPEKAMILDLGMLFDGDGSWVQHGFDRFREITAAGQRALLAEKTGQPQSPLTAGGQPAFKPTTDFQEAGRQLRERLRQQQSNP